MKNILFEALTPDDINSLIVNHLNPLSEQLIQAARSSKTYKATLDHLNTFDSTKNTIDHVHTFDPNREVSVQIQLSYRNVSRAAQLLDDELNKQVIEFFTSLSKNTYYVYKNQYIEDLPMYAKIPVILKIREIKALQQELSIFHKIEISILDITIYTVYGTNTISKAYSNLQSKLQFKKQKEEIENNKDGIPDSVHDDEIENLPHDKHYEFLNLPKKSLDLSGAYLLKWF